MTADLINLNRARKAKARAEKTMKAEQNRLLFGRTKAEKEKARREEEIAGKRLDGHRIEPDGER